MNIALVIAGGSGHRMGQDVPKQFISVHDRPVIIYTMQAFQNHPSIDAIQVVCLDGWHDILRAYAKQFDIGKLIGITSGGRNGQASIRNGILALRERFSDDDIVLVHDAIRPMVSEDIISDCISKCQLYGSAVAAIPCAEAMIETQDKATGHGVFDRDKLMRTQTPQAFPLGKLLWAHDEAQKRGITDSVASCTLMIELGETIHFSSGSEKNIKLTTVDDLEIFEALLKTTKPEWLK
jgi:2-C-methyl-D-erythritol 4-phosphate cytidylyltransferase